MNCIANRSVSPPMARTTAKARRENITAMLAKQVEEWNKGNIAGYMVGYWENDSLLFIGKNGPTYGYKATLERYKKSYPDAKAMGKLTSTILSLKKLSDEYFFVVGKWELKKRGRRPERVLYFTAEKDQRQMGDRGGS